MWMLVTCFGTSILTALLPWMNAEVMLLSATRFVASQSALMGLVAVVTAGQMTGKTAMYWLARKAADARSDRQAIGVARQPPLSEPAARDGTSRT